MRQVQVGSEFTITVRGRPVACLGPLDPLAARAVDIEGEAVTALLAQTPVDEHFASDLGEIPASEAPADDPSPTA